MHETAAPAPADAPGEVDPDPPTKAEVRQRAARDALLIGIGWFGTGLAFGLPDLPLQFLLKDQLHLRAEELARFGVLANIPIYVKPLAGILSDAVPLFGTRRRHYLLISLFLGALCWLAMGVVPPSFHFLVLTFITLNLFGVMVSTVLGGVMVEVGKRDHSTGRLSAQRLGISKVLGLISGPVGGQLAKHFPFHYATGAAAALQLLLVPLFGRFLKEPPTATIRKDVLVDVQRQAVEIARSKTLWSAAGLVILVVAAPGFGTPLFYYQTDVLRFDKDFIGLLAAIGAASAMVGAMIYHHFCRKLNLRQLLAASIVIHAVLTLLYLAYRTRTSAMIITGIESATMVLALLPLYDLAARATPKGSEALGYSVMMSVWNFTTAMSNWAGAMLYDKFHLSLHQLVWLNSGTTALVLVAVPFLPAVLMDRREDEPH
jgi:predicted MFS family arabinose efflux permease